MLQSTATRVFEAKYQASADVCDAYYEELHQRELLRRHLHSLLNTKHWNRIHNPIYEAMAIESTILIKKRWKPHKVYTIQIAGCRMMLKLLFHC